MAIPASGNPSCARTLGAPSCHFWGAQQASLSLMEPALDVPNAFLRPSWRSVHCLDLLHTPFLGSRGPPESSCKQLWMSQMFVWRRILNPRESMVLDIVLVPEVHLHTLFSPALSFIFSSRSSGFSCSDFFCSQRLDYCWASAGKCPQLQVVSLAAFAYHSACISSH